MRNNTCVYWTKNDEVWQRIMKHIIRIGAHWKIYRRISEGKLVFNKNTIKPINNWDDVKHYLIINNEK